MMSVQAPKLTVSKSKGMNETIRSMYINYLQMMIDCAKDPEFMKKLFADNELRLKYLREKVGMKLPDGVHVIFDTKEMRHIKIYINSPEGQVWIEEGSATLDVIEKLKSGDIDKESLTLSQREEVDVDVSNILKDCDIVLRLPFINPNADLMMFELNYDDTEIVFSTCIA